MPGGRNGVGRNGAAAATAGAAGADLDPRAELPEPPRPAAEPDERVPGARPRGRIAPVAIAAAVAVLVLAVVFVLFPGR
jgi:hypothetical protein